MQTFFYKKQFILLMLIVILAGLLRFWQLGAIPDGFHRDEAFLGYNAYSILLTGKDMTGENLPIHLESFLYSPAGYSYATIPFIWLFGLSPFSVRFASALFGTGTVLLAYFIVKELFRNRKATLKKDLNNTDPGKNQQVIHIIALLSAFCLAISPWHINLSRVATENVIVVFFITIGVFLYMLWVRKNNWLFFILSFFAFGLTIYIYQAPRAFLPLFLPCLFLFSLQKIKDKKWIFSLITYGIVIILPVLLILHSPTLSVRMKMLSITNNPKAQLLLEEAIREDGISGQQPLVTRIFHNKITGYGAVFLENYSYHLTYRFLFTDSGLPDRYRIAGIGILYLFSLPFLIAGIIFLFQRYRPIAWLLLAWVLLAPVGSALTFDDIPNLQRTLIVFPALIIIEASGIYAIWILCTGRIQKISYLVGSVCIITYSIIFYLHAYYVQQLVHRPWYRAEGMAQLISVINNYSGSFDSIKITSAEADPGIFFLFFNKVSPAYFQEWFAKHPTTMYGYVNFGKFNFFRGDCPLISKTNKSGRLIPQANPKILYVNAVTCKTPKNIIRVKDIKRKDGTVVFRLLRYLPK